MQDFRKLKVWAKAHRLTLAIYEMTSRFPREELFGLTSQMRRACVSIPANIAEGCGGASDAQLARSLQIAMGSASELECLALLACDLGFMKGQRYEQLLKDVTEIKRMLTSFLLKLRTDR